MLNSCSHKNILTKLCFQFYFKTQNLRMEKRNKSFQKLKHLLFICLFFMQIIQTDLSR